MAGLVDEQTCRRFSSGARRLPSFGNCRSSATLVDATMQTTSTDRTDNALSLLESNNTVRIVSPSPSLEDACTSTIDCNKIVRMVLTPSPSLEDSCTSSIDTRQENNTNESSLERETNAERTLATFSQQQLSTHQYHPLQLWLNDANALVRSLASSSLDLVRMTAGIALKVAFLPISIPLRVVTSTSSFVVHTYANVSSALVNGSTGGGENTESPPIWERLFHTASQVAGRTKDDLGNTLLNLVAPVLVGDDTKNDHLEATARTSPERYESYSGESSAEQTFALDRLRLDYSEIQLNGENDAETTHRKTVTKLQYNSARSKFLLRVVDLGLSTEDDTNKLATVRVHYIDLSLGDSQDVLILGAMNSLVDKGLALFSNCSECRIQHDTLTPGMTPVQWKPEGSTKRLLRKKIKMTQMDWSQSLESEILVWSGKCVSANHYGKQCPLFLARGIVPKCPRDFLRLLWDNERTSEYNKWSLGRKNLLVLEDGHVLATADEKAAPLTRGTKVIESETKVPFTRLSVTMSALMHVRPLEAGNGGEGYVIVSRSLNTGRAGSHLDDFNPHDVDDNSKNEMIFGINVLRSVPGCPDKTDLTSLSHYGSSLVPGFLAKKIGMTGFEDFFSTVRLLSS